MVEALRATTPGLRAQYDWSGGLVWLSVPSAALSAATLHAALAGPGGHARLMAPAGQGSTATGTDDALGALGQRVRRSFDPQGVFAGSAG